jgi:hypothetical protein
MSFGDSLNFGASDALQAIKNAAGIVSKETNSKTAPALPWDISNVKSTFFRSVNIDPNRWDTLFPYRLMVIDTQRSNKIVSGPRGQLSVPQVSIVSGTGSTIVDFKSYGGWIFQLPITPQQLNITDQFAINTSATLRGIIEEHSGVRFKTINASGSLGVWPQRESITKPPTTPGLIQSVFGGTIAGIGNVVGQAIRTFNTATTGHPANKPVTIFPEASTAGPTSTGLYQAQSLQQFLEQYAEAKKDPSNASWRLVFDIPKQNQSFVVTPMQYVWQQSAADPLEIKYSFQLKAWRRIDLHAALKVNPASIQTVSPGLLQRVLNTVTEARRTLSSVTSLIGAVRSDITAPLEALRQTALFVKDAAGVAVTAADMPGQIVKDYQSSIKQFLVTTGITDPTVLSDPAVSTAYLAIKQSAKTNEGLSMNAVSSGQLGTASSHAQSIDPANNVFNEPEKHFDLINQVPVTSLSLNSVQQSKLDQIITDARSTSIDDLKKHKNTLLDLALQLSNNFGAGDAFFSQIYGKPAPKTRIQPMTLDEFDILAKLYATIESYDTLTATTQIDDLQKQSGIEYVSGLADQSGIQFNIPTSKILMPVPFGLTMEGIAARYLGDPQRWLEIATLNNLRSPYIDENGFTLSLLSNATGRQATVNNADNLFIGQIVTFKSSSQLPTSRKILGIDRLSEFSFLITVDGLANLDNYVIADKAYIQAYLPGTVNSQQKIFIPSELPVPNDPHINPPASVSGDPLVGLSKVDLLLTDDGDLAINNFGDLRYSAGMTNLIQALRIKLGTPKGRSLLHPEFGLGLVPGTVSSDIKVQEVYDNIQKLVNEDPRFQGLNSLQIVLNGPTLTVNMGVILANQNGVFPVSFEL